MAVSSSSIRSAIRDSDYDATVGKWGAVTPAIAGAAATSFPTAPDVHFHPNSQSATLSGTDLVSCPDIRGLADLTGGAGSAAPKQMTDALGRKFWRFDGAQYATIANTLSSIANRAMMVVVVARVPHANNSQSFLNPRFAAYTSPTVNTQANASIGMLRATVVSSGAPYLLAGSPFATTNATDCYKVIPGSQLQVMGLASRTTANGGTRLYMNNDTCDVAQQSSSVTGYLGAIINGTAGASNTENVTTSANSAFDLYEIAIWNSEVVNANSDAVVAAAVTNYGIAPLDEQLVLEGDSITFGSPLNFAGLYDLTEPGSSLIPTNVRVVNFSASGSQTSNLATRRDAATSVFATGKYPGGAAKNKVAFQIGANDVSAGAKSAATLYADIVALINTTTTGYLQRVWSVVSVCNVATGNVTNQAKLETLRDLLADTSNHLPNGTFLTDTLSNTGQTYEGLVDVLHLYDVTVSGDTKFKTSTDSEDTTIYQVDKLHPTAAGGLLMASGGDTPQYGYGSLV